ncbi:hypothetical protein [uncultured Helicobacter sp.]|uniref:hypothetical protein n=1 Tax=uncultured Helicobacter sp. TaxID=175537 RepID=UPI001C3A6583|nr:hypothetical protein [Candidatus Helicobacter avicola]
MKHKKHILIIGLQSFGNRAFLRPHRILRLTKDPHNPYDPYAIYAQLPYIGTIGYLANTAQLLFEGCVSARGIYFDFTTQGYAKVEFIAQNWAICELIPAPQRLLLLTR